MLAFIALLSPFNPDPRCLYAGLAEESGSDEDFMVDDDDDSDYGQSKKKVKKVSQRGRKVEKKEKKSPKPRLKATGTERRALLLTGGAMSLPARNNDICKV